MPVITASQPTRRGRIPAVSGGGSGEPSNYPLELVSPREAGTAPSADSGTPNMPSRHRMFKAYPGIEYSIKAVVIGGSYPYAFSLSNAPSGMTVNASTGVVTWTNPSGSNGTTYTPTLTVTDAENTSISEPWTITISDSTADFIFVDATNGNDSNSGSLASPKQTLAGIRSGVAGTGTANKIVYFRAGTYSTSGLPSVAYGGSSQYLKCGWGPTRGASLALLAYPGETVTVDQGYSAGVTPGIIIDLEPASGNSDDQPIYIEGITFQNCANNNFRLSNLGHYHTWRNVTLRDVYEPAEGENSAGIMFAQFSNPFRHYVAIQDCTVRDMMHGVGAGGFKFYSVRKLLVENLTAYDAYAPFDLKNWTPRFEIRGCVFDCDGSQYTGIVGDMNNSANTANSEAGGEIRYNRITARSSANPATAWVIELNRTGDNEDTFVYRNTLVGRINVRGQQANTGAVMSFKRNVIISDDSSFTDNIYLEYPANIAPYVSYGSAGDSNLVGTRGSGIVDEADTLALVGTYRTTYLGTRGHEIA